MTILYVLINKLTSFISGFLKFMQSSYTIWTQV